jgi:hypothetical protein
MGKLHPKGSLANLERDFRIHLEQRGNLNAGSVRSYIATVRRFLKYVGNERLDRISDDVVRAFFSQVSAGSKETYAVIIGQFLRFAAAQTLPATVGRGSAMAPARAGKDKKELALRQSWAVDKLVQQKEAGDDLLAKLARKVIDHYLFFQGRINGEPENLDDLYRFADECKELIQTNLPLFMSLSAQGRNIHSIIDERVQK